MKKNNYMGIWVFCMILMLSVGIFSYVRNTYADFNGLTGNLSIPLIKVTYFSNYSDTVDINDTLYMYNGVINSTYFIEKNMFDVPNGYMFHSWNTMKDGSGVSYKEGKFYKLEKDMNLYAIWGNNILGDINLDGKIDENDTILLNKYVSTSTSSIIEVVAKNADVNLDGKIDLIDVDIIKQALLGTVGYSSLLSNEPVFVYEIYKPTNSNNNNNNNNNNSGGSGTGNNGNGNHNGGSDNNNGGSSSGGNSGNGNGSNNSSNSETNDNKHDNIENNINDKTDNNIKNEETKSYIWLFVLGICFISLRIMIDIIKKIVNKNKE